MAGLAVASPLGLSRMARAEEIGSYDGPLWITINCSGGWDPTMVCDPKGNSVNQSFTTEQILTKGPFAVAPIDFVDTFFEAHKSKLMVINGIDLSTNNHEPGKRNVWSGRLGEGHPNIAALIAGCAAPDAPMAFINDGGYEETAGLVTATRPESSDLDFFKRIANPNYVDAQGADTYHDDEVADAIRKARKARLDTQRSGQTLPRARLSMDTLYTARVGQTQLKKLIKHLENPTGGNKLIRQLKLTLAAYQAGLVAGAHLSTGGFDTHDDHDNRQTSALSELFLGLEYLFEELELTGLSDSVVVMVSSDFSRTPTYNGNNGKDHWPYTSMMLYGPGRIPGGRLLGATDEN
ncbi:MAG: DUF1501 domain-containing protein, partial [Myxococcota bacterium]|nr:DUF1501 domain-containing protein [Myxococcota bacterium]